MHKYKAINPRKIFEKRLPIVNWLPKYNKGDAISDLIAGLTVGMTMIPQSIAYSALAGLGPQYGLYSAFIGVFIYVVFGTTPEVIIGPTALLSLLTYHYTHGFGNPQMAVLFCFLCGLIQLLFGILRLGFLVEFISEPVTIGFTSATSLIIASSQLKGALGLKYEAESFLDIWKKLSEHISEIQWGDAGLSFGCCIILLSLRSLKYLTFDPEDGKKLNSKQKFWKNFTWFFSVGRNALIVIICSLLAYVFQSNGFDPFVLTGKITSGFPDVQPPHFTSEYHNTTLSFVQVVQKMNTGLVIVPIVAVLQNIAIAKAFAKGRVVDATQEMLSLGLCNVMGSFFSSYVVSGSFSRGAVSNASGIRTPFGGIYAGVIVLLAISFLTPYFYYIPKATLSSVIICAIIFMIDFNAIKPMWKTNKYNLLTMFITFFACIFAGVELGILAGVLIDIVMIVYNAARPQVLVEKIVLTDNVSYLMVTPKGDVLFPAIDNIRKILSKASQRNESLPIVLNCSFVQHLDYTAAQGLNTLANDLYKLKRSFIMHRLQPKLFPSLYFNDEPKFIISGTDVALTRILIDIKKTTSSNEPKGIVICPKDHKVDTKHMERKDEEFSNENVALSKSSDLKM